MAPPPSNLSAVDSTSDADKGATAYDSLTRSLHRLDYFYKIVKAIILDRQHPVTGLLPASTAVTVHGDYRDAWVRDNVYSIMSVWGLALAYRKIDDARGIAYELEKSVVKLMRGLLFCMMRQADKVEKFKNTQMPVDSLHAKYNTSNCEPVVGDLEWGHLQLDATSIFLLMLAQMTASGIQIIFTFDEVDFIQNLVYYVERAYRTPDYGIWERGNKSNHGQPELNSSSIGMATAAMEAINGLDLFGSSGGPSSVIHVLEDEIVRNYITLCSVLPRESPSKEIDAALLSVIGFPAFAVPLAVANRTRQEIVDKLEGVYGCKRFLRDGHQTVLEDTTRLFYESHELTIFENIECEWPLFFTYFILDGLFRGDREMAKAYQAKLEPLLISKKIIDFTYAKLVPEVYFVPEESVNLEKEKPKTQKRLPNENVPLVWAQSLYILGQLLDEELLLPAEIDPLGRRLRLYRQPSEVVVQVVILSESAQLQAQLATVGLETQILQQIEPTTLCAAGALRDVYTELGVNSKLELTGRPPMPVGTLVTCKLYRIDRKIFAFTPQFMDMEEFYLTMDHGLLVSIFQDELAFVRNNWTISGRPTMCIYLKQAMFPQVIDERNNFLAMLSHLRSGSLNGIRVRVGRMQEMLTSSHIVNMEYISNRSRDVLMSIEMKERSAPKLGFTPGGRQAQTRRSTISFKLSMEKLKLLDPSSPTTRKSSTSVRQMLAEGGESPKVTRAESGVIAPASSDSDSSAIERASPVPAIPIDQAIEELKQSTDLYEQADLLEFLNTTKGPDFFAGLDTVRNLMQEVWVKAAQNRVWSVARQMAALLRRATSGLAMSLTDLLVRQKQVTIGAPTNEMAITSPLNGSQLKDLIFQHCGTPDPRYASLVQEILTYLGSFVRADPHVFDGILRVRLYSLILGMRSEIVRERRCMFDDSLDYLMELSPLEVKMLLQQLLYSKESGSLANHRRGASAVTDAATRDVLMRHVRRESKDGVETATFEVSTSSAGFLDGNNAMIVVNGVPVQHNDRGMNLVVIDPLLGVITDGGNFDTHLSHQESEELASFIEGVKEDAIVVVAAKDEASVALTGHAKKALESIGSDQIGHLQYRDSWCIIGQKGAEPGSAMELHQQAGHGPTAVLKKQFQIVGSLLKNPSSPANPSAPKKNAGAGRWLRRRQIEGALNRVPSGFYPKVWTVLDHSLAIVFESYSLPRDPTVSEMTAGETNFAVRVETMLEAALEPIDRQLAVECLVALYDCQARFPDCKLEKEIVIKDIQDEARRLYFVANRSQIPEGDKLNEKHESVVKLFADLPQQGPHGTLAYFGLAATRILTLSVDSPADCRLS